MSTFVVIRYLLVYDITILSCEVSVMCDDDIDDFPFYPKIGDVYINKNGIKYEYIGDCWVCIGVVKK